VKRQTYGYLPGRRASPPFGWYQIVLLDDRGTWSCCLTVRHPGVKQGVSRGQLAYQVLPGKLAVENGVWVSL